MAKGFGIAAFVLLLLSFPIPFLGSFITLLALALVTIAALAGDKVWPVTVTVISAIKLLMLSPSWHAWMFGSKPLVTSGPGAGINAAVAAMNNKDRPAFVLATVIFLAAPIVALVWRQAITPARTNANSPSS